MIALASALFLVAGAGICLIAAIGVLRLPDFFLRMHAATKAGVAGAGLLLIGVGLAEPSPGMWAKIVAAITFLLLTTPVAGHLLARAGYVAGVPLWGGTHQDDLEGTLRRGRFDLPIGGGTRRPAALDTADAVPRDEGKVVLALAAGPAGAAACRVALGIAAATDAPLLAVAIVDAKMLARVGPVPVGGNHYAAQLRRSQMEKARRELAGAIQTFEEMASAMGVACSVAREEGDPVRILKTRCAAGDRVVVAREGWFDHGVGDGRRDPHAYLVRQGIYPLTGVATCPPAVSSLTFIHDGTAHSDATLDWLIDHDPWPGASIHLVPDDATGHAELAEARRVAAEAFGPRLAPGGEGAVDLTRSQVLVFGNDGHAGWINRARATFRPDTRDVPIVVFG